MTRTEAGMAAAIAFAALASCTSGAPPLTPTQQGIDRTPRLTFVAGCSELETDIEDAVVLAMKSELDVARRGLIGLATGAVPSAAPSSAGAGPESYTTTNVQVAGVDEADFVQNDGTRIAALAGGRLHLLRSWPAEALAEAAAVEIEGWPRALFLAGQQAIVFSSVYVPRALEGDHPTCLASAVAGASVTTAVWCGYSASDVTKITAVDVSSLDAPRVTSFVYLPGSYLAARRIDDRVRLVMTDRLPFPDGVRFWTDATAGASDADRDRAFSALATQNEALIRARSLDDWLRRGSIRRADGTTVDVGYACGDFAVSSGPSRPGILTVATIDLTTQALSARTSVLAQADVVYASRETLYAAASHWWWSLAPGQEDATYLHAFDLTDPDRAPYVGSGVVDGTVGSQYQLDEHAGTLRVVSALTRRVADGSPWGALERASQIAVLRRAGGALETVGKTAPFGAGESLFGTRFLGTRGFAITARQIDPLFTFDLSDPAHPVKTGEVTMPGFISYLHPIDETHLLGVGRERAGGTGPMQVKVQLLDVSDLAAPRAGAPVLVGEGWSWSDALWDPKAFTWFPARGVLAIPFADFASTRFVSDLRLFRVDAASGIAPLGSLSMADVYVTESGAGWSYSWSPYVRRSILADDFVYAISDAGVRSARVADLPAWLRTATFPPLATQ